MTENNTAKVTEDNGINVVFERISGHTKGGRFFSTYHDQKKVDEIKQELANDPETSVKIVAEGVSISQAQAICQGTLTAELCVKILENTPKDEELYKAIGLIEALKPEITPPKNQS